MNVLSTRVIAFVLLTTALFAHSVLGQLRRPMPKIEPGTIVDVNDWGGIKQAEFIEVTQRGWIKVRMEDGEEKEFFAHDVRISKVKKAKSKSTTPVAGGLSGKRTWSDATGKFKVDAQFVALAGDKVELKKADGSTVSVPLAKLSSADQDIAKALAAGGSSAPADDANPFEASSGESAKTTAGTSAAAGSQMNSTEAPVARQGDAARAKTIQLSASGYAVPPIASIPPPKFTTKGIPLPQAQADPRGRSARREAMLEEPADNVLIDRHRGHAMVAIGSRSTFDPSPTRVERLDLATGKPVGTIMFPPISRLLDIDASGKLVIAIAHHSISESATRIDLFRLTGGKADRVMQFQPYVEDSGGSWRDAEIDFAGVVGTSHLLTCSGAGKIVLWKLPDMSAVYSIECGQAFSPPALSADQRVMAVTSDAGVFLLDPLTGDVFGQLEQSGRSRTGGHLTFDEAGKRLALVGHGGVQVFNVATGKLLKKAGTPVHMSAFDPLGFAGERYLLANEALIDLDLGIVLCKYTEGIDEARAIYGGRMLCVLTDRSGFDFSRGLTHFEVPHTEALAKAQGISRESLVAVKQGEKVGVQLNVSFSPQETQRIRDAFVKVIQDNGWVYSDDAPIAILSAEVTSKSRDVTFKSFRGETTNVTQTDYFGNVYLKKSDKIIWQTGTSWHAPSFVQAKEGEVAQEATKNRADHKYFLGVKVPNDIIEYPAGGALCTATVSATGVTTN